VSAARYGYSLLSPLKPENVSVSMRNMEDLLGIGVVKDLLTMGCNLANDILIGCTKEGGKKGKGYVYIICSLNPKHKQQQG
jgi:hypothetical protein